MDERFEEDLYKNLPSNAEITIGNSFELARNIDRNFDVVVLDNPQGCYGERQEYCEHFEAIEEVLNLLPHNGGLLIFNVKTEPFNYGDKIKWQQRRNSFYNLNDCSKLSLNFIQNFYKDFFSKRGFETHFCFLEKRPQEPGLYALTIKISRS